MGHRLRLSFLHLVVKSLDNRKTHEVLKVACYVQLLAVNVTLPLSYCRSQCYLCPCLSYPHVLLHRLSQKIGLEYHLLHHCC